MYSLKNILSNLIELRKEAKKRNIYLPNEPIAIKTMDEALNEFNNMLLENYDELYGEQLNWLFILHSYTLLYSVLLNNENPLTYKEIEKLIEEQKGEYSDEST